MRRWTAGVAIALALLVLYLGWTTIGPRSVSKDDRELNSLSLRPQPLEPLGEVDLRATRAPVEQAEADHAAEHGSSEAPRASESVRLIVLARADRRPQPGVEVVVSPWPPQQGDPASKATTDVAGTVEVQVTAADARSFDRVQVTVRTAAAEQVFPALPLQRELVVLIEDCTLLHGRVVVRGAIPELGAEEHVWVALEQPARGAMTVPVSMGRTTADAEGRFSLQACPTRSIPEVDVCVSRGAMSVTRRIPWDVLASAEGARIEFEFQEVTVRVIDESGGPLVGAAVRIAPLRQAADPREEFPAVGQTDAHGEFRASLEARDCTVIAGMPGHADESAVVSLAGGPQTVVLRLRPLGEQERLRGRVVREDGTPVAGAVVTAAPVMDAREAAMAAFAQTRADERGAFELAIAGGREVWLVAFHRDVGMSDELRFVPDGREPVLVIRGQGTLEVRVAPPVDLAGFAGGLVEYVLVDRRLQFSDHGHEFHVPFEIHEVPAGDYNVFVHIAAWDAYAEASAHVGAEVRTVLELNSRPARLARGRVLTAAGAALGAGRIELQHPRWPAEVAQAWSCAVDREGRFELLLGEETACPALLTLPGGAPQRIELHAGDDNLLRVD